MYRHCPSAKRVSKAREDLPEPETPVTTVSRSWGISSEMFLRLFCRAPSMRSPRGCDISRRPPEVDSLAEVLEWRQMHAPIHVLAVDDDAAIRRLLGSVLARHQHKVVEAASGAAAMDLLSREAFDVALIDIVLPDRSGLDVLRWARTAETDTEFVVLTGLADVETAVEAMRLGAYDFVTKPWKNAELLEVVAKAAEKKFLRRENVT